MVNLITPFKGSIKSLQDFPLSLFTFHFNAFFLSSYQAPKFINMLSSPIIEKLQVSDLLGLISRKVIDDRHPGISKQRPAGKLPPHPDIRANASHIENALSVYNGWIDFDLWLNLPDTTWSKVSKVCTVLKSNPRKANQYLDMIGLPASDTTAGLMCGKMTSMKAICVLREIFEKLRNHNYKHPGHIYNEAAMLNHFIYLTPFSPGLAGVLFRLGPVCNSLDELEIKVFSHYLPVDSLVLTRRIFKSRIRHRMITEYGELLYKESRSTEFCISFLLGMLCRLSFLKIDEAIKNEQKLNLLCRLVEIYKVLTHTDYTAVINTMGGMFKRYLAPRPLDIQEELTEITYRIIYHRANKDIALMDTISFLQQWEIRAGICIHFHPRSLYLVYRAVPYFDYIWARKELREAIQLKN